MMQQTTSRLDAPRCVQTLGFDAHGNVLVRLDGQNQGVPARLSARITPKDVERFVASGCDALVLLTDAHEAFIIDFIATATSRAQAVGAPHIITCDGINLPGGARLFVEGHTLHLRAHHMHLRAAGDQRLMGATINVG